MIQFCIAGMLISTQNAFPAWLLIKGVNMDRWQNRIVALETAWINAYSNGTEFENANREETDLAAANLNAFAVMSNFGTVSQWEIANRFPICCTVR